jgi:hypothetical protein
MLVPLETSGPRSPACPPGPLAITRASKPGSQGPRELDRQQQVNYHTLLGAVGHGSGRKAWIALSLSMVCSVRTLFGTRGRAANVGCDSIMSPAGDCLNHAVSGSGRRPIYLHFPGQSDSIRSLSLQGVLECLGSLRILSKRRGCPCATDRIDCYRTTWDDGCPRLYRLLCRHSRSVMDGRNWRLQIAAGPA